MAQCRFMHVNLKFCILIDASIDNDKETVHHVATGRFIKTKRQQITLHFPWL